MSETDRSSAATCGERVLFISPSWIGDMLMALPAFEYLRGRHAGDELIVLAKPQLRPLWELISRADRVVPQQPGIAGTFRTAAELREFACRRAYIAPNSFRSALIARLAAVPERIGFRGHWRRPLLTRIAARRARARRRHQACEMLDLVAAPFELEPRMPPIEIDPELLAAAIGRLQFEPGSVGLIPGAARGPSKCWPEENFCRLGRMLSEAGFPIAVFGAPSETELCGRVAAGIGAGARGFAGKTGVAEWAALISACSAVVANDSGGMHLAAALGVPVAALYGITDPGKTGPLGEVCRVLQQSGLRSRKVPRESHLARKCLESITPESVYNALRGMGVVASNRDPENFI